MAKATRSLKTKANPSDPFGQIDPSIKIDDAYFAEFTLDGDASMRNRMLAVTIDHIGRVGPTSFNAGLMCEVLGIVPSLVNHHFGSRDELVAEAAVLAYAGYVEKLWRATNAAANNPEARLRAWIEASVAWTVQMNGWGPVLNYPKSSLAVTAVIEERYESTMSEWGELNMARLFTLISDVKHNRVTTFDYGPGQIPKTKMLLQADISLLTTSIGWSILGLATWSAGRHLPTRGLDEIGKVVKIAQKQHIDRLIATIRS